MKQQHLSNEAHNTPIRLSQKELDNPEIVISNFFTNYTLNDVRKLLQDWMVKACYEPVLTLQDCKKRGSLMLFRYQLESLLEANYMLLQGIEHKKRRRKSPPKQN